MLRLLGLVFVLPPVLVGHCCHILLSFVSRVCPVLHVCFYRILSWKLWKIAPQVLAEPPVGINLQLGCFLCTGGQLVALLVPFLIKHTSLNLDSLENNEGCHSVLYFFFFVQCNNFLIYACWIASRMNTFLHSFPILVTLNFGHSLPSQMPSQTREYKHLILNMTHFDDCTSVLDAYFWKLLWHP